MHIDEAINSRRSVRKFLQTNIDSTSIIKILDAGRNAPSAKNKQPWSFYVVMEKALISDISTAMLAVAEKDNLTSPAYSVIETAEALATAPVIICVYTPRQKTWPRSDYISIGACLENMTLEATALGLGSLIVCDGWCAEGEINGLVGCNEELAAMLAIGYAENKGKPAKKKSLESITFGISDTLDEIIEDLPEIDISNNKNYVFISYCHKDKGEVLHDIVELKKLGVALWYDRGIAVGEKWDKEAITRLNDEKCKGMILYVSENSLASKNVEKELINAIKVKGLFPKDIITVHIGDKSLSQYKVEMLQGFRDYLSESKIFIPRGYDANGNTFSIKETVEPLGVIYENGLYEDYKFRRVSGGLEITKYSGTSKNLVIPSEIGDKAVVSLGKNSFSNNDTLEIVTLPFTIMRIEDGAFLGCKKLWLVALPNSIENIGTAVFRDCIALKRIKLPPKITILAEAIFRGCSALEECKVPYGVTEFKEAVFRGCSSIKTIIVPETVKTATEGAFFGCSALEKLILPKDIKGLNEHSFDSCPLVTILRIGE